MGVQCTWPELPEKARFIEESEARAKLLQVYFEAVGAAQLRSVKKTFQWDGPVLEKELKRLVEAGKIVEGLTREDQQPARSRGDEWLALPELIQTT